MAPTLKGEGFDGSEDGTGRGTPIIPILEAGSRTGISTDDPRAGIGVGEAGDPMFTLQSGKQHAVAFGLSPDNTGEQELMPTLTQPSISGGGHPAAVAQHMAVRRLTPRECERLQGFPDGYTAITYRGKPAADGPRYRAIGNSMAVPCMNWLGKRIQMVDDFKQGSLEHTEDTRGPQ